MLGQVTKCAIVVLVMVFSLSCAKVPEPPAPGSGDLEIVKLTDRGAIPAEWGDLVATELSPDMRYVWLWFQDEEGTVRMVTYSHRTERISQTVRVFRRN